MPIIFSKNIENRTYLSLWRINEDIDELISLLGPNNEESLQISKFRNEQRIKQWISCRIIIKKLLTDIGKKYTGISKDINGKPFLKEIPCSISLSHSKMYAAAILCNTETKTRTNSNNDLWRSEGKIYQNPSIDIELIRKKILVIAPKFLTDKELIDAAGSVEKTHVYWSAKEVIYKSYGLKNLDFKKNMKIHPFKYKNESVCKGELITTKLHNTYTIHYKKSGDLLLVYYGG